MNVIYIEINIRAVEQALEIHSFKLWDNASAVKKGKDDRH